MHPQLKAGVSLAKQRNSRRHSHTVGPSLLLVFLLGINVNAQGGRLGSFERDARNNARNAERDDSSDDHSHSHSSHDSFWDDDDDAADSFADLLVILSGGVALFGGLSSWERVAPSQDAPFEVIPRQDGQPLLPIARVDAATMWVSDAIDATDFLAEVGYGPFAAQYAITRYDESDPDDELDVYHVLGLFRLSYGNYVEVGMGFGALTLDGEDSTRRFAFALPVLIHPHEHLGLEIRPLWSDLADRYDVAGLVTWEHVSLKGGYRWLTGDQESLNGPYIGVSLRY